MKRVVLVFPDITAITNFLLKHRLGGTEINSTENSLNGVLTDDDINDACVNFGATIKLSYSVNK